MAQADLPKIGLLKIISLFIAKFATPANLLGVFIGGRINQQSEVRDLHCSNSEPRFMPGHLSKFSSKDAS